MKLGVTNERFLFYRFRISELNCLKKKIADLLSIPLDVLQEKYIKR